jgi:hypothetical protein
MGEHLAQFGGVCCDIAHGSVSVSGEAGQQSEWVIGWRALALRRSKVEEVEAHVVCSSLPSRVNFRGVHHAYVSVRPLGGPP